MADSWTGEPDSLDRDRDHERESVEDEWEGPHQCCADFGAILRTERTGRIYRCAMCRFEWAVPFSAEMESREGRAGEEVSLNGVASGGGDRGLGQSNPRRLNSESADSRTVAVPSSVNQK